MAGTYYNPMGGQQMYNPMTPYQNRLSQYEQQYPQYNMQNQMQGYQNMPQNAPNQQSFIKGRAVTSFDEAKASMIDDDRKEYGTNPKKRTSEKDLKGWGNPNYESHDTEKISFKSY